MKYFTKEVKIGIAGIVTLCLLVYGINYLKGVHLFRPTSYFYVQFENITGLTKSSPVFADGYPVGIVRNIYYDYSRRGSVVVEVGLNAQMNIPKGSSAELVTEILGGARMNILPGDNPHENHATGDTIPGRMNNGLMESVTAVIPQVKQMIPKLDSILTSLNTLLNNPDLPAAIRSLRGTAENFETTGAHLNKLLSKDVPRLTDRLTKISDNFLTVSNNLKSIDYAATFQAIDETLAGVRAVTDQLNNGNGSLRLLLSDPQLYTNLNATFVNASDLLEDLQKHPKRYVHFSLFGRKNNP